jgi:hypothetical protein
MHDCEMDGVDYLTELTKWAKTVSCPLSCPGPTNATTMMPSSARPGVQYY